MLQRILIFLSGGFLLGVFAHSVIGPYDDFSLTALLFFGFACLCFLFGRYLQVLCIGILCIGIGFGFLRFAAGIQHYQSTILDVFAQEQEIINIIGVISSDPLEKPSYTEFTLDVNYLDIAQTPLALQTQILVRSSDHAFYEYGQSLSVRSKIEKPTAFETDSGRVFDYSSYLAKNDIYYIAPFAKVSVLGDGEFSVQRSLYRIKNKLLLGIYRWIPQPESGLLAGILFGEKSALDDETETQFRAVGLMHIVVLSGYNVALVIFALMALLKFLPLYLRSVLVVCGIAIFAILVGAGPTVIRASIMAVFIVLARVLGLRYDVTRALIIAGIVMVAINPRILYFDISFQLSFLASYGLIVFSPFLEKYLLFLPEFLVIRESAVTTLSAQLFVLPLLLYSIGEFSLISPVVNVLVLFAVPLSMITGFSVSIFSLFSGVMASVFAFPTSYLLKYQLWVVDFFAQLPFAHIRIPQFHWIFMVLMYIALGYWVRRIYRNQEGKAE